MEYQFVNAPLLESERLLLRPHHVSDLDASAQMWGDPIVTQFIGGKPCTRQQAWTKILVYAGHWKLMGFGYWAVEEKSSRSFIGEIGFADFKREITPSIAGTPELGWALLPSAHGKGYATEALLKAIEWAESGFTWNKSVCMIHPNNKASIRVAEKLGFKEFTQTTYASEPTILFERTHNKN